MPAESTRPWSCQTRRWSWGRKIGIPDAMGCFSTLRGSLAALGAATPHIDEVLPATDPLWPVFPLLRAWGEVNAGQLDRAAALMRGFAIQDIVGKYDLELLAAAAIVCAAVGSQPQREWVYARLEPHAGLHAVIGGCAAYHDAVDYYLGLLAAALGRTEQAAQHFYCLDCDARAAREPGLGCSEPSGARRPPVGSTRQRLPQRRRHLVARIRRPASAPAGCKRPERYRERTQYAVRLTQLEREIADADARNDSVRSEQACAERDSLVHELTVAVGLGRRARRLGDETEKARKTVGARIRDVLQRIERVHPALARHLRATISTGMTCVYAPPDGCQWLL
jgi:hypothetical protein